MPGFMIAKHVVYGQYERCENLRCQAPLEPPYETYRFRLEESNQLFVRTFCVKCIDTIKKTPMQDFYFELP